MRKLFTISVAAVLAMTALSQQPAYLTNGVAWDPSPTAVSYDVFITTNKVAFGTNGYVIPPSAILHTHSTPFTQAGITNMWPQITNGVYSVFVTARNSAGVDSITSSNLVFQMVIPPLPVRNLRLQ